jgi:hypothetical protein
LKASGYRKEKNFLPHYKNLPQVTHQFSQQISLALMTIFRADTGRKAYGKKKSTRPETKLI